MFFLMIPVIIVVAVIKYFKPAKTASLSGKHVVVTGGSSGIGKACAILAAQRGAHVTIIARNIDKLIEAQREIQSHCIDDEQLVTKVSVDIIHYEDIENNLSEVEEIVGPIYMLINCAGMAICGKIEDYTEQQIKALIDVNFLGSMFAVKAIVPKFKKRKEGIIVLTASQLALMGMFGMTAYAACKFALRGLAESLYMEVKNYNVSVTLALPPDTDTPGLEEENKTKPAETKILCATAGLTKPEVVAEKLMNDALEGKFFSYVGFESYILTTLCVGMSPVASILDILAQVLLLGPLRLIAAGYIMYFNRTIRKFFLENEKRKQE